MERLPNVVAVINTSQDTTTVLRSALEAAGFVVVTAFTTDLRDGHVDLEHFMQTHRPKVIVYDIAIPYEENWRLFQHISSTPACRGAYFVLTTANALQVEKVAGREHHLHEIVGKPLDLDEIVRAVRESARRRPTG